LSILYEKLSDLLQDMIQGGDSRNFERFFNIKNDKNINDQNFSLNETFINHINLDKEMTFNKLLSLIKNLFDENQNKYIQETVAFKMKIFQIMNNMMIDGHSNFEVYSMFTQIFRPDDVILYVSFYFKKLIQEYSSQIIE
jgi:hypothetical protein